MQSGRLHPTIQKKREYVSWREKSAIFAEKQQKKYLQPGKRVLQLQRIINRLEYLENGKKVIKTPQTYLEALEALVATEKEKEQLRIETEQQQATIELQDKEIKEAAPKVNYYNNHLQSVNTLTSTQIAKQIGMDAEKLHKKLKDTNVIYRQSGQWLLHSPYSTWGLHSTRTQTYTRSDGSIGTNVYTVWTERGRRFIIALYENEWNVRKAIKQIKGEIDPDA